MATSDGQPWRTNNPEVHEVVDATDRQTAALTRIAVALERLVDCAEQTDPD